MARHALLLTALALGGCNPPPEPAATTPSAAPEPFRFEVSQFSGAWGKTVLDAFGADIRNNAVTVMAVSVAKSPGSVGSAMQADVGYNAEQREQLLRQLKTDLEARAREKGSTLTKPTEEVVEGGHLTGFTIHYAERKIAGTLKATTAEIADKKKKHTHRLRFELHEHTS